MFLNFRGLRGMLEQVYDLGSVVVSSEELKRLCGRTSNQRMTKGLWREVREEWMELNDREGGESSLLVGENAGSYSFIFSDNLVLGESEYWCAVEYLADKEE